MSFQIIYDILDFTASPEELGKPSGSDLIQGNITLPVLYAMNDDHFLAEIKRVFHDEDNVTEENIEYLIEKMRKTDAVQKSYDLSNLYLQRALHALESLENNKAKRTLQTIANLIGKRRS